ncbi:hypothetical protein A4G19_08490 [Pasteurellaceae bacterium Macca]|nr:hypothetical protein [Pasteurellaceae bacterium Macca]
MLDKSQMIDKNQWATPFDIFHLCEKLTGLTFNLDAAANVQNRKCERYISEQQNTLKTAWGIGQNVWLNPPYSNPLPFVEKAILECKENQNNVAMLLNADCSTRWFELCRQNASEIIFFTGGRVAFLNYETGQPEKGNTRPQMLAVFYHRRDRRFLHRVYTRYFNIKAMQ